MHIRLSYTGYLNVGDVANGDLFEVDEGTSVTALLNRFNIRPEHHRFIRPLVNGNEERLSYILKPNDDLMLVMPIGGG